MQKSRGRKGFTLPEVLVTLAIVATLAAVLLPALNSQLSKGDAGRAASDIVSLQTAVGAFASDVRRYPDSLSQLTTAITTSNKDINGVNYTSGLVAKWKGPYLSKSLVGGILPTSFGANIGADFASLALGGVNFLTVTFSPIAQADFDKVDLIIDETVSSSTGQLQFSGTTGTFYAAPLQ